MFRSSLAAAFFAVFALLCVSIQGSHAADTEADFGTVIGIVCTGP